MPLDEQQLLGFYYVLGYEFCYKFWEIAEKVVPRDAYEIFFRVFGADFQPDSLRHTTDSQMERLQEAARHILEYPIIGENQLQEVIDRTLLCWPPDPTP